VVAELEDRRSRTWATVLIDRRYLPVLMDHFGRHFQLDGTHSDDRARARVGAPTPLDLARNLAGWGSQVEVVEPEAVRRHLGRISRELAELYGQVADNGTAVPPA
jgi:predicted DNA-binding transcriptional regulator YafY